MSMNAIHIVGNLGGDVEVKKKADNTDYWSINVATGEKWKDKTSGEMKEKTTWHKCVLYGNYANLAPYLRKGTTVAVTGKQRNERYPLTDKEGNKFTYPDGKEMTTTLPFIIVQNISLVGGRSDAAQPQAAAPQAQAATAQAATPPPPTGPDEDLPF